MDNLYFTDINNISIRELLEKFSNATAEFENLNYLSEIGKRIQPTTEYTFTASDTDIILGELCPIKIPGFYKVVTEGKGKGSFVVRNPDISKAVYSDILDDNDESEVLCIATNDLVYLHASADSSESITIKLIQYMSMFDIITEYLRQNTQDKFALNKRIDNIIATAGNENLPTELVDLRSNFWGELFNSANERIMKTEEKIEEFNNYLFPSFESDQHSYMRTYKPFTFVRDAEWNAYVSKKSVPTGILITDTRYWVLWDVRDATTRQLIEALGIVEESVDFLHESQTTMQNIITTMDDINESMSTISSDINNISTEVNTLILNQDATIFVSNTGSDSTGDGSTENPYSTITHALSKLPKFLNGHTASVVVAAGTYLEDINIYGFVGNLKLLIQGDVTVNSISVEYSSVLVNSSIESKYTITSQWINIKNRSSFESYTNVDYNITSSLTGVVTGKSLSMYTATSSSVYISGNVFLTGNTDTAIGVFSKTKVYIGGMFGSGFNRGSIVDAGSELSVGRNNLVSITPETLYTGSVSVSQFGAVIGTLPYNTTLYVSPTGSDETGTGTSVNPLKTINRALLILPKDLGGHNVNINIAEGVYNEDLILSGIGNSGTLTFVLSGNITVNSITTKCSFVHFTGNDTTLRLLTTQYLMISENSSFNAYSNVYIVTSGYIQDGGTRYSIFILKQSSAYISGNTTIGGNTDTGILVSNTSNAYFYAIYGSGFTTGLVVNTLSQAVIINNNLSSTSPIVQASGGQVIQGNGTQISNIISSGLSCTWGTISGGYRRIGNISGYAQVVINIRVTLTQSVTAGTSYTITGFPLVADGNVYVACTVDDYYKTKTCYVSNSSSNSFIYFVPLINVSSGLTLNISATYTTSA